MISFTSTCVVCLVLSSAFLTTRTSPVYKFKRGSLSYIVHKGCLYLSHYVRDNYPVLEPTHDVRVGNRTNWVDWANDIAASSYLPQELLHALVECGQGYTFFALSAPQSLIKEHGTSLPLIPGK